MVSKSYVGALIVSLFLAQSAFAADPQTGANLEKGASPAQKSAAVKEVKSEAVEEVDGVKLDEPAEKKGFSIGDLNPLKWIFKPITDVQAEVKRLGKQLTKMETPITDLQQPTVDVHEKMVGVQGQMVDMRTGIGGVQEKMRKVDSRLGQVEKDLNKIYGPVVALKEPVIEMKKPVQNMQGNLKTLKSDMRGLKEVVSFTQMAILIAVVGVGALIVIGTPIAALLVWKHRARVMKFVGGSTRDVKTAERQAEKAKAGSSQT